MNKSESIVLIATALSKAQGLMASADFDAVNPHFKNKYASLASVVNACRVPMATWGLSFTQSVIEGEKGMHLETTVMHESGEWISSLMPLYISKDDMQGLGSAITYAKRYALSAMLGIVADEDDDGNAASKKKVNNDTPKPKITVFADIPGENDGVQSDEFCFPAMAMPLSYLAKKPISKTETHSLKQVIEVLTEKYKGNFPANAEFTLEACYAELDKRGEK